MFKTILTVQLGACSGLETFRNPPITEAVIDIKTELGTNITLSEMEKVHEKIRDRYPTKKVRRRVFGSIEFKDQEPPRTESKDLGPDGYLFWSNDDRQVVQYRLDGFTFSRLRPYKDWAAMRSEATPLWNLFLSIAKPVQVTRIALRYINSIEIPVTSFSLDEYITSLPRIPEGLSQIIQEFLSRVVINFPEVDSSAVVTCTSQPPKSPTGSSILLDIDVYRHVRLSPESPEIWEILSGLRNLKNDIFSKYLTEKTKELFN